MAELARSGGKDEDVEIAAAAYHSQSFHCGCEIGAEAQDCYPRAWKDCDFELEGTLGRSHCRDLEEAHTYPWVAVVVLKEDLAVGRSQTCQGAWTLTSRDTFFGRMLGNEGRMTALWVEVVELIENSEEVNGH